MVARVLGAMEILLAAKLKRIYKSGVSSGSEARTASPDLQRRAIAPDAAVRA
jgi:hypothetical protein